jgi:hypothetical protein
MAVTNKLISGLPVVPNAINSDLIVANHLGTTSIIPLSTIMNYIKEQITTSSSYRTDILNSLSSEFIKRPSGEGAGKILAWNTSTQTWVASAKFP